MNRVTEPHANLRVPARVYDVVGRAIFSKNSTFVFFDGLAWTPRLRSPSPIMAPVTKHSVGLFISSPVSSLREHPVFAVLVSPGGEATTGNTSAHAG